jgi:hypothetical protein
MDERARPAITEVDERQAQHLGSGNVSRMPAGLGPGKIVWRHHAHSSRGDPAALTLLREQAGGASAVMSRSYVLVRGGGKEREKHERPVSVHAPM